MKGLFKNSFLLLSLLVLSIPLISPVYSVGVKSLETPRFSNESIMWNVTLSENANISGTYGEYPSYSGTGTFSNSSLLTYFEFNITGLNNNTNYAFNITSMCDSVPNCNTTGYVFNFSTSQNIIDTTGDGVNSTVTDYGLTWLQFNFTYGEGCTTTSFNSGEIIYNNKTVETFINEAQAREKILGLESFQPYTYVVNISCDGVDYTTETTSLTVDLLLLMGILIVFIYLATIITQENRKGTNENERDYKRSR